MVLIVYTEEGIKMRLTENIFSKLTPHGMAFESDTGAYNMKSGDILLHIASGRLCRADEFLSDGEAFVTFPDGNHATVKWLDLQELPPSPIEESLLIFI